MNRWTVQINVGLFGALKRWWVVLSSDRAAQIELLHALAVIAAENNLGQGILVKIKFNIIASLYDYNPNLAAFMKVSLCFPNDLTLPKHKESILIWSVRLNGSDSSRVLVSLRFRMFFLSSYCSAGRHVEEMPGLYRRAAGHPVWTQQHLHRGKHRRGQRESDHLRSGDPHSFFKV